MNKLFEIKNLEMKFPIKNEFMGNTTNYVHALNNITLDIVDSEILGLVGESGSGKSTLGNCILKLLTPTSGEIIYKNENITNKQKKELKEFRKNVQPIFQNPYMSLNPRMKVFDILKEPFIINGIKDKEEIKTKINKIIQLTGLSQSDLEKYPHEFSGGQRQRIAIARSIILNPHFIVADEPVSALDVSIQAQIINLLLELKKELNLTMLFISHDLSVVKYISDRIAVMYLGEIVEIATKEDFFKNYKHPYSKILIDAVPLINSEKKKTIEIYGDLPSPQNLPKGCKFGTRCPYVMDKCKCQNPDLKEISENHFVRCFLMEN